MKDREIEEAEAFDAQIRERVDNGHIPDLRRSGRCEYFYNNVWRDQEFVKLYFGEVVEKVIDAAKKYSRRIVPAAQAVGKFFRMRRLRKVCSVLVIISLWTRHP